MSSCVKQQKDLSVNPELFLGWFRWAVNNVEAGYFGHVERVYCYELYHLIRVLMFKHEREHGDLGNIYLHSEITKTVIDQETAQVLGVFPLSGLQSPDFILHEPQTTDNQIAAVEVKVVPNLSYAQLIRDIEKLTELSTNYGFRATVFLGINQSMGRIRELVRQDNERSAVQNHEIIIMTKEAHGAQLKEATLGELLLDN